MRKANIVRAGLILVGVCAGAVAGNPVGLAVKAIATGGYARSLALASDGTVWQWGYDGSTPGGRSAPVRVSGLSAIAAIATEWYRFNLALKEDGTVWAWDSLRDSAPFRLTGLDAVTAIAGSEYCALALKRDGTVWANCHLTPPGPDVPASTLVQVGGISGVAAIASGLSHNLALKADGTVWAWGMNSQGQLGDGTTTNRSTPVQVSGLTGAVAIAASRWHSIALRSDGTVWEWGNTVPQSLTPVQVNGLAGVAGIAAGDVLRWVVKSDGTVWVWGNGQPVTTPAVQEAGLSGVTGIVAGMALKEDGTIWAWGNNDSGQLGDGTTRVSPTRIRVNGLTGITAVAGGMKHSLALKDDGTVWAWGGNEFGQLGDGTTTDHWAPGQVSGLKRVKAIGASIDYSLALDEDGTVWAWGSTDATRTATAPAPVRVSGLTDVAAIAAGRNNLALKNDGTVWTWGTTISTPTQVSGLSDVAGIAVDAGAHSLAFKRDGTVWTWGFLAGWDGTTPRFQLRPVQVDGLGGVVAAALAGGDYMVAKDDGTVWEWGLIWDGTGPGAEGTPYQVRGIAGAKALAGGSVFGFFCYNCGQRLVLKTDGTVWAWGTNDVGQLGVGPITGMDDPEPLWATPAQVAGLAGVVAIGAGDMHSLAVTADGTVWAWGANFSGQLGADPGMYRPLPVQVIQPGAPDLAIALSHDGDFTVGAQAVYSLTTTNTGATPTAGEATVTDILPPGLTYLSATGTGWTCSAVEQTVRCTNPGPFGPGASSRIELRVDVGTAALPGVTNFATAENGDDRNVSNNAVSDSTVVSPSK